MNSLSLTSRKARLFKRQTAIIPKKALASPALFLAHMAPGKGQINLTHLIQQRTPRHSRQQLLKSGPRQAQPQGSQDSLVPALSLAVNRAVFHRFQRLLYVRFLLG